MGRSTPDATRPDEGDEPGPDQTGRVRPETGIFSRRQRRWAWFGFLALALHAPVVAMVLPDDSWLLSVTVAALVAFVIIVDDVQRGRSARE